jgi:hypothetical protein
MTGRFREEIAAAVACLVVGLSVADAKPKIMTFTPSSPDEPNPSPSDESKPATRPICGPYPERLEGEFAQVRTFENQGLKEIYTTTGTLEWRKAKDLNEKWPSGFLQETDLPDKLREQVQKAYDTFPKNTDCGFSLVYYNLIGGRLKVTAEYHSYNKQFGGGCDAKGEKPFEVAELNRYYSLWIAGSDTMLFLVIPDSELAMEVKGSCKFPRIKKQPFNSAANDNAVEIIGRLGKFKEGVHGQISPAIPVKEYTKISASWDFESLSTPPAPDAENPKP